MGWCYSYTGERYTGDYPDRDSAIRAAAEDYREQTGDELDVTGDLWLGIRKACFFSDFVCVASLLDEAKEAAYDEFFDLADDWIPSAKPEAVADLLEYLNRWAKKYGLHPEFFHAENARPVPEEEIKKVLG